MNTRYQAKLSEVTGKYEAKIVTKHAQTWKYDSNGGENLCYKSSQVDNKSF
jgi:hypothetical protein